MLRPSHPLFNLAGYFPAPVAAKQTPAQVAASLPSDFSQNTSTVSADTMIDAGEASHDGPGMAPAPQDQPQANPAPQQPQQPVPQFQQQAPIEQPLPSVLQPQQQPAAPVQAPVQSDPLAAMTASMRVAFPGESPAQIAKRVADALTPAVPVQQEPVIDPDAARVEEIGTQLATLRKQAAEEGTSDFDAEINSLEREQLKLETRLEVRNELQEDRRVTEFAQEANQWESLATQAFPDADSPGSPLKAAVDAKLNAVLAADPDYFTRSPDAGYSLVASEAAKLGIAPKVVQQGAAPAPGMPQHITVPVAMPGSMQASHRPSSQVQPSPQAAFAAQLAAAEQHGFAGELALARQMARGGFTGDGVQFVS